MTPEVIVKRVRWFLLILAAAIYAGVPVELYFAEHTQEQYQKIPFILCGIGLVVVGVVLIYPRRYTLWPARLLMVIIAAGGLLGMCFHMNGNFEFELEIRPNATRSDVLMDALRGANPLLAPGILAFGAMVVLIATYYHPALHKGTKIT